FTPASRFPSTPIESGLQSAGAIEETVTRVACSTTSIQVRAVSSTRPPAFTATRTPTSLASPATSTLLQVTVLVALIAIVTWCLSTRAVDPGGKNVAMEADAGVAAASAATPKSAGAARPKRLLLHLLARVGGIVRLRKWGYPVAWKVPSEEAEEAKAVVAEEP